MSRQGGCTLRPLQNSYIFKSKTNQMSQTEKSDGRQKPESVTPEDVSQNVATCHVGEDVFARRHVHDLRINDVAEKGSK